MTDQTKEYQDEHVKVSLKQEPHCLVNIVVDVSPQASAAAYSKAMKTVKKEVVLPGFRKGKAPDNVVQQRYAPQIDKEFRDVLLNTGFSDAIRLTGVHPFNRSAVKSLKIEKYSPQEGATIRYIYETYPEVPHVVPEELHIKKIEPSASTDELIDYEMQQLAYRFAEWENVEDRAIEEGDYVDLDIEAIHADHSHPICTDTRFHVQKGKLGDWLHRLLIGLKVGESTEGMSEKEQPNEPLKEGEDEIPFQSTHCRITLRAIKRAVLPAIDDAFAKRLGVADVSSLRQQVDKLVEARAKRQAQEKMRDEMRQIVSEKYHFDIPDSLLKKETETRINQAMESVEQQNELHHFSAEKLADIRQRVEDKASRDANNFLRLQYLLFTLARHKHLDVSEREVLEKFLEQSMLPEDQRLFDSNSDYEKMAPLVRNVILLDKALDYIIAHAHQE